MRKVHAEIALKDFMNFYSETKLLLSNLNKNHCRRFILLVPLYTLFTVYMI